MPANRQARITVKCPHCANVQEESAAAYSTFCKQCSQHFRIRPEDDPFGPLPPKTARGRRVHCFKCHAELQVAKNAESTMCQWCSSHVDLRSYFIAYAISKNFQTRGRFVIEEKGYVFNTDSIVGDAVIKGRFLGRLEVTGSLEIHPRADIKGDLFARHLLIPAATHLRYPPGFDVESAEIAGELASDLAATGTVTLNPGSRFFGNLRAQSLIVREGAILVGHIESGPTEGKAT
ncbi:MAG TPA: polymer-forming cytoskeletal protein [Methylomirabilota bacterium]|nr:polymer-forming cytoskeletal protein [Methylomirabilota bacterium]